MAPSEGWDGALGVVIEEMTAARVLAHVDIDERHLQPYGIVHGGVWASIVETVASHGAAAALHERTGEHAVVGTSNATDFLRPHRSGRVQATGTPVFVGRTQQLWLVEITRVSDGKLLARGQVRLQNLGSLPEHRPG